MPKKLSEDRGVKVLVNGCFDRLHAGHEFFLRAAEKYGALIVGLNSDVSVRTLKGPNRPFQTFEERREAILRIIPALKIIPFDGDASKLIKEINPDIIIRGWDQVATEDRLCIRLPRFQDMSTTSLNA